LKGLDQFQLNRLRVSDHQLIEDVKVTPIENDWQNPDIIPYLGNNLDILIKNPGIYRTESINQLNQGKIDTFYTRLPQYSEINEDAIAPYFKPG